MSVGKANAASGNSQFAMIVLCLIVFVGMVGFGIILPLFPFYAERFGATPEVITWTMSGFTLGQFVAAPIWGRMSDAFGRRPVLMLTMLGQAIGYVALAFADSVEMVIASRVWGGLMAGNISAAFAYVADITTPEKRAAGLGMIGAALGLGFTFGPAIGGLLAGAELASANYEWPALSSAVLSMVAMLGTVFVLPESLAAAHRKPLWARAADSSPRAAVSLGGADAARAALWNLLIVGFMFYIAMSLMESIFPLWANDVLAMGPRNIGVVFFGLGITQTLVQGGLMGPLTKKAGERTVAIASGFFFSIGLVFFALAGSIWQVVPGIVMFGIGIGLFNPSVSSLVSKTAAADQRGAVMGVYQAASALGRVVGPGVSGLMYSKIGMAAPFALGAAMMLPVIGMLAMVRLAGVDERQPAAGR